MDGLYVTKSAGNTMDELVHTSGLSRSSLLLPACLQSSAGNDSDSVHEQDRFTSCIGIAYCVHLPHLTLKHNSNNTRFSYSPDFPTIMYDYVDCQIIHIIGVP